MSSYSVFFRAPNQKGVTNKPDVLQITTVDDWEQRQTVVINTKTSATRGKRRSNVQQDVPAVWLNSCADRFSTNDAESDIALRTADKALLVFVETKGGKTQGRQKQRYVHLLSNALYCLDVPRSKKVVAVNLRSKIKTQESTRPLDHWIAEPQLAPPILCNPPQQCLAPSAKRPKKFAAVQPETFSWQAPIEQSTYRQTPVGTQQPPLWPEPACKPALCLPDKFQFAVQPTCSAFRPGDFVKQEQDGHAADLQSLSDLMLPPLDPSVADLYDIDDVAFDDMFDFDNDHASPTERSEPSSALDSFVFDDNKLVSIVPVLLPPPLSTSTTPLSTSMTVSTKRSFAPPTTPTSHTVQLPVVPHSAPTECVRDEFGMSPSSWQHSPDHFYTAKRHCSARDPLASNLVNLWRSALEHTLGDYASPVA